MARELTDYEIKMAKAVQAWRQHLAPQPGMANAKECVCHGCGGTFWQWVREYRKHCSDCALERQLEAARHAGEPTPEWERRTVLGAFRYWAAEADRLGLTLPDDPRH